LPAKREKNLWPIQDAPACVALARSGKASPGWRGEDRARGDAFVKLAHAGQGARCILMG